MSNHPVIQEEPSQKLTSVRIHSDKLNLDFNVYVQDETIKSQQRCYIMTVHDLGCDCKKLGVFFSLLFKLSNYEMINLKYL